MSRYKELSKLFARVGLHLNKVNYKNYVITCTFNFPDNIKHRVNLLSYSPPKNKNYIEIVKNVVNTLLTNLDQ